MNDHYLARSEAVVGHSRTVVADALRAQVATARKRRSVPVLPAALVDQATTDPDGAAREAGLDPQILQRLITGQHRMSVGVPWNGRCPGELAEDTKVGRGNRTPRIAAETMTALLDWSLRIVEDIGPDIRDAWREFRQLFFGTHPVSASTRGLRRPSG